MSRPARQRGQTVVLLAVMVSALCAMAGLAIDGGRAYVDRRELQAAVDAGVLAAGDTFRSNGSSFAGAEPAAVSTYALNERIYGASTCSPAWAAPASGASLTFSCTWSSSPNHSLSLVVTNSTGGGSVWSLTATHSMSTSFIAVVGRTSMSLSATASANTTPAPANGAIITLNKAGCPGYGGQSLSITGSAGLTVSGDVHISGTTTVSSSSTSTVSGNYYSGCGTTPGQITTAGTVYPNAGPFADPGMTAPPTSGLTTRTSPGNTVNLQPGAYPQQLNINSGCVFFGAGVYDFQSGFNVSNGFASNKLRPPDEPVYNNNTQRAANQFWGQGGTHCDGAFSTAYTTGPADPYTAYVVTSERTDSYNGTTYVRESAPSMCRTPGAANGQAVQINISNVPGATSYNIYAASSCAGPFGYVTNVPNTTAMSNQSTSACPSTAGSSSCTLGTTSIRIDGHYFSGGFAPSSTAAPRTYQAYPPAGFLAPLATGLPDEDPAQGSTSTGDSANENMCAGSTAQVTCPGTITPGAVAFNVSGQSLSTNGGTGLDIFAGGQYGWILIYQPASNTQQMSVNGGSGLRFTGIIYAPSANLAVTGSAGASAPMTGQFIVNTLAITGSGGVTVNWDPKYAPSTYASRLIL